MAAPERSAVGWAREHGQHFVGSIALDNYEPVPRTIATVQAWRYDVQPAHPAPADGARLGWILDPAIGVLRRAQASIYLMDTGTEVTVCYVAGWHPGGTHLILHPFPLSRGTRPDNGQPVDMSNWFFGPRLAYHVKLHAQLNAGAE